MADVFTEEGSQKGRVRDNELGASWDNIATCEEEEMEVQSPTKRNRRERVERIVWRTQEGRRERGK